MDRKFAALSMDVEDWYHLDCLQSCNPDTSKSMLDGFVNYAEMLNRHGIKATFFVLGELGAAGARNVAVSGWLRP